MDQIKHTFGVSSVALTDSIANQSPDVSPFSDLFSEDEEIQRSIFAATMPVTDVIPFSDLLATDEAIQPDILEATYMPEYFGYDVTPNAESKSTSSVSISHRSTALTPFSTSSSVPFEENQRQRKRKRRQGM
jgi:hypothetical protein